METITPLLELPTETIGDINVVPSSTLLSIVDSEEPECGMHYSFALPMYASCKV